MKIMFLYGLVRTQVKFEPMKEHWLLLAILYTGGVTILSYVFIFSMQPFTAPPWQQRIAQAIGVSPWLAWVGETLLLSALYFRMLGKFDEGAFFWVLIVLGFALVWF
jgi:hypothetical protein